MSAAVDVVESPATKAVDITIPADASVGQTFQICIEACLSHLRPNEVGWLAEEHTDYLHQTRVSTRRLRALLSLMRVVVRDDPVAMDLKARLREILRPLGPARDLDVALASAREQGWPDTDIARLAAAKTHAYANARAVLEGLAWKQLWAEFDAWRYAPSWLAHTAALRDGPARAVTDGALEHRYRRVLRAGERLLTMSDHDLHRVRIEGKKLRYGCQFFDTLYPESGTVIEEDGKVVSTPLHFADQVAGLQEVFGRFNDFAVAQELRESLGLESAALDEPPSRAECVAAWEQVAALEPFWRVP